MTVGEEFLKEIGFITAAWSALEAHLEFTILRSLEIDPEQGLILTAELSAQSKIGILEALNDGGAFEPLSNKAGVTALLDRIRRAHAQRNKAAHRIWAATDDPHRARRMTVRSRRRISTPNHIVHIEDVRRAGEAIAETGRALNAFTAKHGLDGDSVT